MHIKLGKFQVKLLEKTVIGGVENPLLLRYILIRFPWIGLYLHRLLRSDFDRALHDHPWPFVSIVLKGGYFEVHDQTEDGQQISVWRKPGDVLLRPAEWRHRVVIDPKVGPATTLVIVGRRARKWGFFVSGGWCWWRKHNSQLNICEEEIVDYSGSD